MQLLNFVNEQIVLLTTRPCETCLILDYIFNIYFLSRSDEMDIVMADLERANEVCIHSIIIILKKLTCLYI